MSRDREIEFWPDGADRPSQRLRWAYDVQSRFAEAAAAIADAFPPAAADLWEIAAACYAVDRRVRRPAGGGWTPDAWHRDIRLAIPVRERTLWQRHRETLERLLAWLTSDTWTIHFRDPRPGEIPEQAVQPPIPGIDDWPKDRTTALFSGGLDSTAGILRELTGGHGFLLAASVATNPSMRSTQDQLLEEIRRRLGAKIVPAPFKLHLSRKNSHRPTEEENTQRSRGFVFLAAGVAAALTARSRRLVVYENGTGAINLPCTWGQVGTQAARPVHPKTITQMQAIADFVAQASQRQPLVIDTPYLWWTKSQLLDGLPRNLDAVVKAAISCDTGFSGARTKKGLPRQCGGCSSCLLRRVALIAAGRPDLERSDYRGTPEAKRCHLQAMLWQVARMADALKSENPWPSLVEEFPDLLCVPSALKGEVKGKVVDLYEQYCADWSSPGVAEELDFDPADWGLQAPQ